jgi:electron transfer flavoprotein alpha subunit
MSVYSMANLLIVDHSEGKLRESFYGVMSAAMEIGGEVDALVVGLDTASVVDIVKAVEGIDKVYTLNDARYQQFQEDNISLLIAKLAKNYTHVVAAASRFGNAIIPRVAAYLGVSAISAVSRVIAPNRFIRTMYSGRFLAEYSSCESIKLITVLTSAYTNVHKRTAQRNVGTLGKIVPILSEYPQTGRLVEHVKDIKYSSDRPTLENARVIVAAGRGLGCDENYRLLEELADLLNAAVGGTRAAVDIGWLTSDKQIGQSAKIVAPDIYVAVGVSGAPQHIAGMQNSKIVVAINKDPEAPIFQIADYGFVGDASCVLPELIDLLRAKDHIAHSVQ